MTPLYERWPLAPRCALAVALFAVALALRFAVLPVQAGLAFLTFYPATVVGFYLCGAGPGWITVVLSALAGFHYFTPPFFSWGLSRSSLLSVSMFLLSATMIGVVIDRLQRNNRHLADALKRISETERRVQSMVASVHEYAILALDPAGHIVSWNSGAERIKGYAEPDILGRHFSVLYPPEDQASGKPAMALEAAATTGRYVDEGWRMRKDGSRIWASVTLSAVRNLDGDLTGYAKVTRDLTDKRRVDQVLRQSEAQYRMLVDGVADGVISIDAGGIVHSFSCAAERMFGYPADQVIGSNVSRLMPTRYRAGHDGHVARFVLQEDTRLIGLRREVTGLRADGSEFPMTLALNVAPGDAPDRYIGLVADISAQKTAERALIEATQLRQVVIDTAPYAVISCDPDGTIRLFNAMAEKMLWYKAEELVGRCKPAIFHDRDEMALHVAEVSRELGVPTLDPFQAMSWKARLGLVDEHEWIYVRKDGSRFIGQLARSSIRDGNNEISGFIGLVQDISERKRREEYTQHVAHHDHLTGLPNRLLLDDRVGVAIAHARRSGRRFALMLIDLDHFKQINDSLGHHIGDEVLKVVAARLLGCVRASDTVARLGGDEFVVLIDELDQHEAAEQVARKIVASVGEPIPVLVHRLQVTSSLGLTFFPDDAEMTAGLLKNADAAMYQAKAAGRNRYHRHVRATTAA